MSQPSIGQTVQWLQPVTPPTGAASRPLPPSQYGSVNTDATIADLARRLQNIEAQMSVTVGQDRIMSQIALSPEAILIQSSKIAVLGQVTFADYVRDINGQSTGVIDPSITTIRGGTIRTQKILSFDGNSWLDLDATGSTPFLRCQTTAAIYADGTFQFGGPSGKTLVWDGTNLYMGATALLGGSSGTAVSTVVSNAANGNTAYSQLANKLNNNAADVLSGNVQVQSSGGLRTGTIAWNSSGVVTSGSGVAITANGLVGASSGSVTFAINASTGAATFAGSLSAATGTFAGAVVTAQYVFAQGTAAVTVPTLGTCTAGGRFDNFPSGGNTPIGVVGQANNGSTGIGLVGLGVSIGVAGIAEAASGKGVYGNYNGFSGAYGVYSDGPSYVNGALTVTGSATVGSVALTSATLGTGTATATFSGTNKPGSNTSNTWLSMSINGTTYYVPAWT